MTQEDKSLLLQDLCARLPYKVICADSQHGNSRITVVDVADKTVYCDDFDEYIELDKCKPYLRPMSSMTQDEVNEYRRLKNLDWQNYYNKRVKAANNGYWLPEIVYNMSIDYLNSIHIDYRGLIEKGLALEAPKDMYNIK